jgi:uncharacterized protein (DUF1800 family)
MSLEGAIAAHRFGLGARPGEIARASADPKAWLLGQLDGPAEQPKSTDGQPLLNAGELVKAEQEFKVEKFMAKGRASKDEPKAGKVVNARKEQYQRELAARYALDITTGRPFAERLVWFWSNHFTVSAQHGPAAIFVGNFEREAIRPHITGTFEDMLFAVCMHPAMLIYLSNSRSSGPDSPAVGQRGKGGLNENLGRELLELHTLGVDGGYTQDDVIAMAKILTGWSFYGGRPSGFGYYAGRHEPGPITLRGKTYPAGWDGGVAAIRDLARDPATARHVANKFATHFIGDDPPAASVARLEKSFKDTHGNLRALAEAAVNDPAGWTPEPKKMRTPVEYVTAAMRLIGWPQGTDAAAQDRQLQRFIGVTKQMGQLPFSAPSPKGWPDDSESWTGADGLFDRIEWARQVGNFLPPSANAVAIAEAGLGPLLRSATKTIMAKASSQGEALALLLSSPEFQRR